MRTWKLTIGGVLLAVGLAGPASAVTVDVNSLTSTGTIVNLVAGSYTVTYTTGAYQAWSPWSSSTGCNSSGANCSTGYLNAFAIDFGSGVDAFAHVDGYQIGYVATPGNSGIYDTPALALAAYQTLPLSYAPLPMAANPAAYMPVGGPFTFTLTAAQNVNFFILDYPYSDNRDGLSLNVALNVASGVPEPSTWALMIVGFAGLGLAGARRRRGAAAA